MLLTDNNRCVIILICNYIYKNRPKLNLIITCKFTYKLINNIFFYERVQIKNNMKNIGRCTNISMSSEHMDKFNLLTNVTDLILSGYAEKSIITIHCFPTKLKKLKILDFFYFSNTCIFPKHLQKLIIRGNFTYSDDFPCLPPNLIYLKFISLPNLQYILHKLPSNLKCLKLNHKSYYPYTYKYTNIPMNMLPSTINHLMLGSPFNYFTIEQIKQLVPKNIERFDFSSLKIIDILHEYPLLTKITILNCTYGDHLPEYLKKIPPNITSIYFKNNYDSHVDECIPSTVTKLRVDILKSPYKIPSSIKKLRIGTVSYDSHNIPKINFGPDLKKLIIDQKYKDLLDPIIYDTCQVIFKN